MHLTSFLRWYQWKTIYLGGIYKEIGERFNLYQEKISINLHRKKGNEIKIIKTPVEISFKMRKDRLIWKITQFSSINEYFVSFLPGWGYLL